MIKKSLYESLFGLKKLYASVSVNGLENASELFFAAADPMQIVKKEINTKNCFMEFSIKIAHKVVFFFSVIQPI